MRRIWAPEWKYITKPLDLTPQILFQIHIELGDHRFGSEKSGVPFKNGKFSCLLLKEPEFFGLVKKKKKEIRLKTEKWHLWLPKQVFCFFFLNTLQVIMQ